MSQFFNYDPINGATELFAYDEATDHAHITTLQDVGPLVDLCKTVANQGLADRGIKESWWSYAMLPATVILELRQKGIDIHNKDDGTALFKAINHDYPYLKTTSKQHLKSRN